MKNFNKIEAVIFDMDGTLYHFDNGETGRFRDSKFFERIIERTIVLIMDKFQIAKEEALVKFTEMKIKHPKGISVGIETEFEISRSDFFANTWNQEPSEFILQNPELVMLINALPIQSVLLSAAPKVWVDRVLEFMQLQELFGNRIFTGDSEIRKPNPQVFQNIADGLGLEPSSIISIGDQEHSDILPAKSIGMMTVKIGVEERRDNIKKIIMDTDIIFFIEINQKVNPKVIPRLTVI